MKALYSTALTVLVGAAAQMAAPGTACARDTLVVNVGMRSVALVPGRGEAVEPQAVQSQSPADDALKSDRVSSGDAAAAAVVPLIETEAAPGESVQLEIEDPRFDFPSELACGDTCPKPLNLQLLPQALMRDLENYPVLDAVVTPVVTGVTVQTLEGLPPVTITVKPTKITQGSGLIAVTRF